MNQVNANKSYVGAVLVQGVPSGLRPGLTLISGVSPSAQFCLGRWEFVRIFWAGASKSKSTQPRSHARLGHPVDIYLCGESKGVHVNNGPGAPPLPRLVQPSVQGGTTEYYSGNGSILYAVREIAIYF